MTALRVRAPIIVDFDCENRPLSYLGGDFTTPELTVVAWKLLPRGDMRVAALGHHDMATMLQSFREAWDEADIATGHNVIRHDLPLINAMLLEAGLPPLLPKLVSDTWADLKKRAPGFASQENLAAMLGIKAPKIGMGTATWREANRLTPAGVEKAMGRAVGDVRQHIALRARILELGWLRPPRMWQP